MGSFVEVVNGKVTFVFAPEALEDHLRCSLERLSLGRQAIHDGKDPDDVLLALEAVSNPRDPSSLRWLSEVWSTGNPFPPSDVRGIWTSQEDEVLMDTYYTPVDSATVLERRLQPLVEKHGLEDVVRRCLHVISRGLNTFYDQLGFRPEEVAFGHNS